MWYSDVTNDHLRQALRQAMSRGLITRAGLKRNPDRSAIESLLRGIRS